MTRGKTIKWALVTAIASKASSSLLQLIALPLAARVLGKEEFGIYSTVTLAVFTLTFLQFGAGPSLTQSIASASAKRRRGSERHFYQLGGVLVISLALICSLVLGLVFSTVPVEILFGAKYTGWQTELQTALLIGLGLLAAEIIMWHTDATRQGYLEAYLVNSYAFFGNIAGALIIIFGLQSFPSIPFLLLATFLPNIAARMLSTLSLWKKRPYLIAKPTYFRWQTIKKLWKDGLSFSATTDLVFLLEVTVCGFLVGRFLGPSEVAIYQVLFTATAIFRRVFETIGSPFWTASLNAKQQRDVRWMRVNAIRFYLFYGVVMLSSAVFLIGLGPWLVSLLYGPEFNLSRELFAAHVCFLAMLAWRDVNRYILIGTGKLSLTVKPVISGLLVSLLLGVFGLLMGEMSLMYLGLASGIILLPGWQLTKMVFDEFREAKTESAEIVPAAAES